MSNTTYRIWFWQRIVSPHMAGLAVALAERGHEVVYVAERMMSPHRAHQGWDAPSLPGVALELASQAEKMAQIARRAPAEAIHLCQGIRANGSVGTAQTTLARRGARQWIMMERVDDHGWRGLLRRLEYARIFSRWRSHVEGVLATGATTAAWVTARGMPPERVFPFAYFLPPKSYPTKMERAEERQFRFLFVGQIIERKRFGLLIDALSTLGREDFELVIIGDGPLANGLHTKAKDALKSQVHWIGPLAMDQVAGHMAAANCLVLPSRHDGWGAVVSESLMVGTPVICSDACGAAEVVRASGAGGVFANGNRNDLVKCLHDVLDKGRLPDQARADLASWAHALRDEAGAAYLLEVLDFVEGRGNRPVPPWRAT